MTRQTVGSRELENDWVALAGSCTENRLVNVSERVKDVETAYLKNILHLLHSFPVFPVKPEFGVFFAFELRNLIAVVC